MALQKQLEDNSGTIHANAYSVPFLLRIKNSLESYIVTIEVYEYNSKADRDNGKQPYNIEVLEFPYPKSGNTNKLDDIFGLVQSKLLTEDRYNGAQEVE